MVERITRPNHRRHTMTSPTTRKRYDNATSSISAWVILEGDDVVGRLVTRRRATSQGHCVRAFLHLNGGPMHEGRAVGGGYDMMSTAISSALRAAWPSMSVAERAKLKPHADSLTNGSELGDRMRDDTPIHFIRVI